MSEGRTESAVKLNTFGEMLNDDHENTDVEEEENPEEEFHPVNRMFVEFDELMDKRKRHSQRSFDM